MVEDELATVSIFRFDPEIDIEPTYSEFKAPYKGCSVLDVLVYIYENLDSSLAYYSSCRDGVCLGCRMLINGKSALACVTFVKGNIKVEPRPKAEIVRDLVVKERKRK